jgi:hypothetical protein
VIGEGESDWRCPVRFASIRGAVVVTVGSGLKFDVVGVNVEPVEVLLTLVLLAPFLLLLLAWLEWLDSVALELLVEFPFSTGDLARFADSTNQCFNAVSWLKN